MKQKNMKLLQYKSRVVNSCMVLSILAIGILTICIDAPRVQYPRIEKLNGTLHPTTSHLSRRADWETYPKTELCKSLIKDPKPLSPDCNYDHSLKKCQNESASPVLFSQYFQDYYLYKWHFKKLERPGIYVDVATNDPIQISNTFFFDHCLGWHGICVEPNHLYLEPIFRKRSCKLVPTCVGNEDGAVVDFMLFGGGSGISGKTFKSEKYIKKRDLLVQNTTLVCTTMKNVSNMFDIQEIDYLSLDVEGHELEVLKGFDLKHVKIKVMSVEGNMKTLTEIEIYLKQFSYRRHEVNPLLTQQHPLLLREDAIFLHKDVIFGSPR